MVTSFRTEGSDIYCSTHNNVEWQWAFDDVIVLSIKKLPKDSVVDYINTIKTTFNNIKSEQKEAAK